MANAIVTIHGGPMAPATLLGPSAPRIPTAGKIRAGIKVLSRAASEQPRAREIYDQGVAAGESFDQIEKSLAEALPKLKAPLIPRNVAWFTVRGQDFANPALAAQLLDAHGEDPRAAPSDIWLDKRLSCLSSTQQLIAMAAGATGARADVAFVINEQALDANFNALLPGKTRYFSHFLCVKNAPSGLTAAGPRMNLAADLSVAIGTSNSSTTKPAGISAASLSVAGGNRAGFVTMPCDPAVHPVSLTTTLGEFSQ